MQILIVALLVIASGLYALWALMPAVLRRALAGYLSTCPLPSALRARAAAAAKAGAGCGCDGCDHAPTRHDDERSGTARSVPGADSPSATRPQPIVFHPRAKR